MYTTSEEDHLKAIFKIAEKEKKAVSTNSIAAFLNTAPASVTDMIKKLSEKELVLYQKYKGVTLSPIGSKIAIQLIPVSYTHLRAHETVLDLVCRLLLEKKK